MMNFLRKYKNIIFIITIITFISSFMPHLFYTKNYAAKVNGTKIPLKILNSLTSVQLQSIKKVTNKQITEKDLKEIQAQLLSLLVKNEILYQQSKLYGIIVTDEELRTYLQNSESFKNNNNIFDKQRYYSFLKTIQLTPKEYETIIKKQICENKLKMTLASSVKLWNYEFENSLKQNSSVIKNNLIQEKINLILNDWYSNVVKNSKITYESFN